MTDGTAWTAPPRCTATTMTRTYAASGVTAAKARGWSPGMVPPDAHAMNDDVKLTPQDLMAFLLRGLPWAVVVAAAVAAAVYVYSSGLTPSYVARSTLVASHTDPAARSFGAVLLTAPPLDAGTYRTAIMSRAVLGPAASILNVAGWDGVTNLAERLSVSTEGSASTTIIRIDGRSSDPRLAAAIADSVAQAVIVWEEARATRSLETIIDALTAQIDGIDVELTANLDANTREGLLRARGDLSIQLSSARALRNAAVGRLELLESALVPLAPVSPRPVQSGGLAAFVAIVLVYGLMLLRQALDVRVRSVEQLASLTGLQVYAEFERPKRRQRRLSREAASYLRSNLMFDLASTHPKLIVVTGPGPRHGKTSVSIALAESFATQGMKTLLMDADLRQPVIGREYGLDPSRAVSLRKAMLSDTYEPAAEVRIGRDSSMRVYPSFVPSPNPAELLGNRLQLLLDRVQDRYDVIVIDSAPLLPVADTLAILPHASALVMVVSMRLANRRAINTAMGLVSRATPPHAGLVVTEVTGRGSAHGRGYGYGYGYGGAAVLSEEGGDRATPPRRLR